MFTNVSDNLVEVSKGYTFVKASNYSGCTIRMFVRVLRNLGGYTRVEIRFPKSGVFTVSSVWHNNRVINSWECVTVDECCCVELINDGICFWGNIPAMYAREFNKYVDSLLNEISFTIELNGKYTSEPLVFVAFRDRDFDYGKRCSVCEVRSSFTLADLQNEHDGQRAFTNVGCVLPGEFEDYWSDDGNHKHITSGSMYAFTWEVE